MQVPRSVLILGVVAAFGCSQAPKAVFVDLTAVAKRDAVAAPVIPDLGKIASGPILPRAAKLDPVRSVTIEDRAAEDIDAARDLIDSDRRRAIESHEQRGMKAAEEEIRTQRLTEEHEFENGLKDYWSAVYDELYAVFREYAQKRGPLEVRATVLSASKPDAFPSRARFSEMVLQPTFAELNAEKVREIVAEIGVRDSDYRKQASDIIRRANRELDAMRKQIGVRFEQRIREAAAKAKSDAIKAIGPSPTSSDLKLGQNKSVRTTPVRAESVAIAGTASSGNEFRGLQSVPITDARERRLSLESQLEIWLKTSGYVRSFVRSGRNDYTEEFDSWRKKHRLGR